jgi:hypothetical protein
LPGGAGLGSCVRPGGGIGPWLRRGAGLLGGAGLRGVRVVVFAEAAVAGAALVRCRFGGAAGQVVRVVHDRGVGGGLLVGQLAQRVDRWLVVERFPGQQRQVHVGAQLGQGARVAQRLAARARRSR